MSDFLAPLVDAYMTHVTAANKIATEVSQSNEGSQAKSLKEWRETSDNPVAVTTRDNIAKALSAIARWKDEADKVAAAELNFAAPISDADKAARKPEYKSHADEAKVSRGLIEQVAKTLSLDVPELPALLNFASGKPAGVRTGTTGTRPRWGSVEVSRNGGETFTVKNLSAVAADIRKVSGVTVSAGELLKQAYEVAGTDNPENITDVTFGWTETDSDKVTHEWEVTLYRQNPSESVENDDDTEDDDTEEE